MGTVRIGGIVKSSPSTQFWLEADLIGQNSGGSLIRLYLRAANGPSGTTGSNFNNWGAQVGYINGGEFGRHEANPFLPGGFGQNQTRWHDGPWDVFIGHGGAATISLSMHLLYGNINEWHGGSIDVPAAPNVPPAPTQHQPTNVTTTSMRVTFSGNGDGGRPIIGWELWRATDPNFTQNVVSITSSGTSDVGGLNPGTTYYWKSRGRNEVGLGPFSNVVSQSTLPATAPGMNVMPSLSGQSATVTLTPPGGVTGVTKYTVEYRPLGGSATTVENPTSPIVVSGLTPGQIYEWRASAWFGTYQSPLTSWTPVSQPNPNTNPGDYFDGASAPRDDLTFSWQGTPGLSRSLANGVQVLGWSGDYPVQRVTGGRSGQYAGRVILNQDWVGDWLRVYPNRRFEVEANATYVASIFVRPSRPQRFAMEMTWWDSVDSALPGTVIGESVLVTDTEGWTRLSVTGIAPADAVFARFALGDSDDGSGWVEWKSGESFEIDDGMFSLATLFPYFDGDTPNVTGFDYQWEGDPNDSISARHEVPGQFVDLLADPDCPPLPPPPSLPTIPADCIDEVGTWRRYTLMISQADVRLWSATLPTLILRTNADAERQVRIRYYANPDGLAPEQVVSGDWVSEQILTYIPANTEITLDGVTERVTAAVGGNPPIPGNRLLYGTGGIPATWPELRCGVGYVVTLDVPLDAPSGNLETRVVLTQRM